MSIKEASTESSALLSSEVVVMQPRGLPTSSPSFSFFDRVDHLIGWYQVEHGPAPTVRLMASENGSREVLSLSPENARAAVDLGKRAHSTVLWGIVDAASEEVVGRIEQPKLEMTEGTRWPVYDAGGQPIGIVRSKGRWSSPSSSLGILDKECFSCEFEDALACILKERRRRFRWGLVLDFSVGRPSLARRKLTLAAAILLGLREQEAEAEGA